MTDMWSREPRARRFLFVTEVLTAGFVAATSFGVVASEGTAWWGVPATLCVFGAFLYRRRSWRGTFALAALGGILQLVQARGFVMFADLLYGPICAAFGGHRDARVRRLGLAAAMAAAVVPGALVIPRWLGEAGRSPHLPELLVLCLMFAGVSALVSVGGWTVGYLRLQQRLRVEAALAAQVSEVERLRLEEISAQSAFRERIAAEMHDVVGHSWAVVAAQADGARYALHTSPQTAERALDTIAEIARSSITELRDILRHLRYTEGVEGQVGAEQQAALVERMRQAGLMIEFEESGPPPTSPTMRLAAYRILTEALTNVLKHGDLTRPVRVMLRWDGGFTLVVENHVGARSRLPGGGLGIGGMRERARSLGGWLETTSAGGSWQLRAAVPAPPSDPVMSPDARRSSCEAPSTSALGSPPMGTSDADSASPSPNARPLVTPFSQEHR